MHLARPTDMLFSDLFDRAREQSPTGRAQSGLHDDAPAVPPRAPAPYATFEVRAGCAVWHGCRPGQHLRPTGRWVPLSMCPAAGGRVQPIAWRLSSSAAGTECRHAWAAWVSAHCRWHADCRLAQPARLAHQGVHAGLQSSANAPSPPASRRPQPGVPCGTASWACLVPQMARTPVQRTLLLAQRGLPRCGAAALRTRLQPQAQLPGPPRAHCRASHPDTLHGLCLCAKNTSCMRWPNRRTGVPC